MTDPRHRVVLGLDPSTSAFGCALLEFGGTKPTVLGFTVITPRGTQSRSARLGEILAVLMQMVSELPEGTTAAIEGGYMGAGAQASLAIAEARGVACAVLGKHGIPVDIVSPKSGKVASAGNGNAKKNEVQDAIASLCTLPPGIDRLPEDASDAAAIALSSMLTAGLWRRPTRLDVNRKRKAKRATSVAQFLKLATQKIGG